MVKDKFEEERNHIEDYVAMIKIMCVCACVCMLWRITHTHSNKQQINSLCKITNVLRNL